jgi:hypothetical protein
LINFNANVVSNRWVILNPYLIVTIASTVPSPLSALFCNERPITLNAVASPACADLAKPFPAETNLSPFDTRPMILTGTLPVIATGGCVASVPA